MPFIDLHCDTIARLLACQRAGTRPPARGNPPRHLEKLRRSGYLLQAFAPFREPFTAAPVPPPGDGGDPLYAQSMAARPEDPLEEVLTLADLYWTELAQNRDLARPVLTFQDLVEARQAARSAACSAVEDGGACAGGSSPLLRTLYRLGVRMLTLTWNYPNELGTPTASRAASPRPASPSWRRWRPWGMLPDVSHLSDGGFWDVCRAGPGGPSWPATPRPGPVAPPAEPHRRDAPGPGGPGLPGRGQLLRRLPGPRGRPVSRQTCSATSAT